MTLESTRGVDIGVTLGPAQQASAQIICQTHKMNYSILKPTSCALLLWRCYRTPAQIVALLLYGLIACRQGLTKEMKLLVCYVG